MSDSDEASARPPARITYTEPAEAEIEDAYLWLQRFGFDVAEKWLAGLREILENEAVLFASVTLRRQIAPDAPEGRELFLLRYRTSGRRGSPWHIGYELVDEDGDSKIDTLRVVRVRHAARGEP